MTKFAIQQTRLPNGEECRGDYLLLGGYSHPQLAKAATFDTYAEAEAWLLSWGSRYASRAWNVVEVEVTDIRQADHEKARQLETIRADKEARDATYFRAQWVARCAEAQTLRERNEKLTTALRDMIDLAAEYLKDIGGCDHDVNICVCHDERRLSAAHDLLTAPCPACEGGFPLELDRAPCCGRVRA